MTPVREAKMVRFFNLYDAERVGSIGKPHFEVPVQMGASVLGLEPGSAQYQEMYDWSLAFWRYLCRVLDKSDGDAVSFAEFLDAMDTLTNDRAALDEIIVGHANVTLKLWDSDGDGMMSRDEFVAVHTAYQVDGAAALVAFERLDRNGDGQLSYEEILQAIDEYFTSDDPEAIGNHFILDAETAAELTA